MGFPQGWPQKYTFFNTTNGFVGRGRQVGWWHSRQQQHRDCGKCCMGNLASIAGGGKTSLTYQLVMDNKGPHLWPPSVVWLGKPKNEPGDSSWASWRGYYLQWEREREVWRGWLAECFSMRVEGHLSWVLHQHSQMAHGNWDRTNVHESVFS